MNTQEVQPVVAAQQTVPEQAAVESLVPKGNGHSPSRAESVVDLHGGDGSEGASHRASAQSSHNEAGEDESASDVQEVALPDGALPWTQGPAVQAAADLGMSVMLSMKYMSSMRYQMPAVHDAVEPGLYPIMFALAHGESRISDIAAAVMSDVSTVSRQVRHLVAEGMVDKLPDPQDRRARLIQLTPLGRGVLEKLRQVRTLWFLHLFETWDVEDVERFRVLMDRFVAQLELGFMEASQCPHGMADVLTSAGSAGETQP